MAGGRGVRRENDPTSWRRPTRDTLPGRRDEAAARSEHAVIDSQADGNIDAAWARDQPGLDAAAKAKAGQRGIVHTAMGQASDGGGVGWSRPNAVR